MLLSTPTDMMQKTFGYEGAVDILARAGYDALDFSFPGTDVVQKEDNDEFFINLRNYAESKGICFRQAHAPFPSHLDDEETAQRKINLVFNAIRYSSDLGIKTLVVHPLKRLRYLDEGAPEKLFEMNMDFYRSLEPYCEKYGVRIALENLWQRNSELIFPAVCAKPEEFIRYIDTLNSEYFVACLDIGHAVLCREDPADFIRALGKKRLKALHIHDVDGVNDSHILPYLGISDWDKIMKALAEIDYDGDFTYEADGIYKKLPKELYCDYENIAVKTGRMLISKYEKYKKGDLI